MRHRMYCIACAHQLAGVRSGRCPECGHRFNPDNPHSFATSPSLVRRVLTRYPAWKRHMLKRWTVMRCRTCGARVPETHPGQCGRCGHYYDPREPEFAARALLFTPPFVVRLGQGSFFLGIVVPVALVVLGVLAFTGTLSDWYHAANAWVSGIPRLPALYGSRNSTWRLEQARAIGGVMWGAAVSMHFHFFWGRIEPFWRFSWLGVGLGYLIIAAGIVLVPLAAYKRWFM